METAIGDLAAGSRKVEIGRNRDWELVRLVGRHGVMTIEQVMVAMGVGRTATYRRAAALIEAGLLERLDLLRSEPRLLHATRDGLRYAGLGMPVAKVSPGAVDHLLRCVDAASWMGSRYAPSPILTEREIAFAEAIEERPIASAEVGTIRGRPRMHRADLAVMRGQGTIAIEVELTPKAPRRLEAILRGWRLAIAGRIVTEVHYLCQPGQTRRAVERARERVRAQETIVVTEVQVR